MSLKARGLEGLGAEGSQGCGGSGRSPMGFHLLGTGDSYSKCSILLWGEVCFVSRLSPAVLGKVGLVSVCLCVYVGLCGV